MTNHRGAYLHALGVIAEARLTPRSSYLWTLPMFHCNGWAYPWAVTAMGAKHVCLPKVEAKPIWNALTKEGVTHLCAAPTVLTTIVGADEAEPLESEVFGFVGGAPPSPTLLEQAAKLKLQITHLYGLTETYGPLAVCAWNPDWDELADDEQAKLRSRQGVGTVVSEKLRVVDEDMQDVPADGETLGEVCMRGDNVMMGYYKDEDETREAFKGGWFHSGDLGVVHEDGYVELRDRLKDVIISGGENIATIEVEQALSAHDSVSEARSSPRRTSAGARCPSRSSPPPARTSPTSRRCRSSRASGSPASRSRSASSCSTSCPRPVPGRSRSSSCASRRRRTRRRARSSRCSTPSNARSPTASPSAPMSSSRWRAS